MNLPPKTGNTEVDRWLFEVYTELQANLYKTQVIIENSDGERFVITANDDGDALVFTQIT